MESEPNLKPKTKIIRTKIRMNNNNHEKPTFLSLEWVNPIPMVGLYQDEGDDHWKQEKKPSEIPDVES